MLNAEFCPECGLLWVGRMEPHLAEHRREKVVRQIAIETSRERDWLDGAVYDLEVTLP